MSPCPVCGSDKEAMPQGISITYGGIKQSICGNCGVYYNKEISKGYKRKKNNKEVNSNG